MNALKIALENLLETVLRQSIDCFVQIAMALDDLLVEVFACPGTKFSPDDGTLSTVFKGFTHQGSFGIFHLFTNWSVLYYILAVVREAITENALPLVRASKAAADTHNLNESKTHAEDAVKSKCD